SSVHCLLVSRHLHSFPTRRSSDLAAHVVGLEDPIEVGCHARHPTQAARSPSAWERRWTGVGYFGTTRPMTDWSGTSSPSRSSRRDRKSTRLNSSHGSISYAVFCLK